MDNQLLRAALKYAELGFSVIPIRPGEKKPCIKWEKHQTEKATHAEIREWWRRWPKANVGIVTGAISGVDVIDVDSEAGIAALNEFLPESFTTPMARTPRGGRHVFLAHREGLSNGVRVIKDTDLRTDGGYVVAAPSVNGNGKAYAWLEGLRPTDITPASWPSLLFDTIRQGGAAHRYSSLYINTIAVKGGRGGADDDMPDVVKCRQLSSDVVKRNLGFDQGLRNDTLFHIATSLHRGGMDPENTSSVLHFIGSHCSPALPEAEIQTIAESVLKRNDANDRRLAQEVREWVLSSNGVFLSSDVVKCLRLSSRSDQQNLSKILSRLVDDGVIERAGKRNGEFRKIDNACDDIDFLNAACEPVSLWLPFGLDRMVEVMPGNIIVIAGEPDAGKTAFLLNVARYNMDRVKVSYFSSEMGDSELRKRLSKFYDTALSEWIAVKFKERADNFGDVIKSGAGNLNVIDFLEIHDNFYEIGGKLAEIHRKLKGAVAIVALQKNQGAETGLGGFRGLEKPRLYITMSRQNVCRIVKAKNWKTSENPNGKSIRYKIRDGCNLSQIGEWHRSE